MDCRQRNGLVVIGGKGLTGDSSLTPRWQQPPVSCGNRRSNYDRIAGMRKTQSERTIVEYVIRNRASIHGHVPKEEHG